MKRNRLGKGGPRKSKTNNHEDNYHIEAENQRAVREFFGRHGELIRLRRHGNSLKEIADETGDSRLGVFRVFQRVPSARLKIELGVPT